MADTLSLAGRRVLVTGGTGFIGGHLVTALDAAGAEVHALTRRAAPEDSGSVRWSTVDVSDAAALGRAVAELGPDLVFHLASHVSGSRDLAAVLPTFQANLASTVGLLAAAATAGTSRVVLAGSLEEPDEADGAPAVPCSPYAAAKWAASGYARMFHALYRLPVVTARLFMVYGPGQRDHSKLVPQVTLKLLRGESPRLSSGTRPVDWVYVEDVVQALLAAAAAPGIEGATVDVGSGALVTVREVAETLGRIVDPTVPLLLGALPDRPFERVRAADVEATESLLGWRTTTALEDGLARTVTWYRDHPEVTAAVP